MEGQQKLLLRNVTLIDGSGKPAQPGSSVIVEDGRISQVTRDGAIVVDGAQVIEGRGRPLIPGLIDMHAHLISGGFDTISDVGITFEAGTERRLLKQMLYWGVTAVYSPVQPLKVGLERRRETAERPAEYPRLFISGPAFTAPGGWAGANQPEARMEPRDPSEAAEMVASLVDAGVDIIKLFYEDMSCAFCHALPKMARAPMEAVIEASRARGLKVMVHAYDNQNHKETMRAGAEIMAHSAVTAALDDEYLRLARRNRILYLGTLSVYHDTFNPASIRRLITEDLVRDTVPSKTLATLTHPGPLDEFAQMIRQHDIERQLPIIDANMRQAWEAGIAIGVGPDTGVMGAFPGLAVHREMELMCATGVPPLEVLKAATGNAAACLRRPDLGVVAPGNAADLLLLDADPLADIRNTRRIATVIRDGRIVDRERLLADVLELQPAA